MTAVSTLALLAACAGAQRPNLQGEGAAVAPACPAADPSSSDPSYVLRKAAFEAITKGDAGEARRLMRCAFKSNGHDLVALRQLVYLDLNAGYDDLAIEDIDGLRSLGASEPKFEAQQGYLYFNQKRYDAAREAFKRAAAGDDPGVRKDALRALQVIDEEYPSHSLEVAIDAQYLDRFNDGVVDAYARYFQRLGKRSPLRAYVGTRLLRDTASQVGPLPQIFSDNALMTGAGLAFQPHAAHYFVSAEANMAYVFYSGRNGTAALVPDYRAVAGYYRLFRPGPDSSLRKLSFQANGSFGFYSRYQHDAIAYLQPQETYDLNEGALRLSPFFQQSLALDTNQQFYNNTAELIPGLQMSLARTPGAALRVEYVRGYYLPFHSNSPNPYGPSYNDFRVRLTFDKQFLLHRSESAESPAGGLH
jgi:tetratricopeptide (TPR) repeat protein